MTRIYETEEKAREAYDRRDWGHGRWRNLDLLRRRLFQTSPRASLKGIVGARDRLGR